MEEFSNNTARNDNEFIPISQSQITSIVQILEERLPRAGHIYNCAVRLSKHWNEFPLYTLNGDISSRAWILVTIKRPDYDQIFDISPPPNAEITPELRQAFIDTKAINWYKPFMFSALDRVVSPLIAEISSFVKGNATIVNPNVYFYISKEDARNLKVEPHDEIQIVKPLDNEGINFVVKNWKYTKPGTLMYAKDMVAKHPSCGAYLKGKPVSAVVTHCETLVGMLTSDTSHRNKGYALLCMKTLLKDLANEGYQPSSSAEQRNMKSRNFHLKSGMKYSHECDYVLSGW